MRKSRLTAMAVIVVSMTASIAGAQAPASEPAGASQPGSAEPAWVPAWQKLRNVDLNGQWLNLDMPAFRYHMGITLTDVKPDGSIEGRLRRVTPDGYHCSIGTKDKPGEVKISGRISDAGKRLFFEVTGAELEKLNGNRCDPTYFNVVVKQSNADGVPVLLASENDNRANRAAKEGSYSYFNLQVLRLEQRAWAEEPQRR